MPEQISYIKLVLQVQFTALELNQGGAIFTVQNCIKGAAPLPSSTHISFFILSPFSATSPPFSVFFWFYSSRKSKSSRPSSSLTLGRYPNSSCPPLFRSVLEPEQEQKLSILPLSVSVKRKEKHKTKFLPLSSSLLYTTFTVDSKPFSSPP